MAEKKYIIPYNEDTRKRHYHDIMRGKVVRFMVQLEIMHEGNWKEGVRYDCAHGYAHRDSYDLRGKHTKEELHLSFEDALTFGDDDIDENWEHYRDIFLAGGIP